MGVLLEQIERTCNFLSTRSRESGNTYMCIYVYRVEGLGCGTGLGPDS